MFVRRYHLRHISFRPERCVTNVKFLATTAKHCAFVIKLIKVSMNLVLQRVEKTRKKVKMQIVNKRRNYDVIHVVS